MKNKPIPPNHTGHSKADILIESGFKITEGCAQGTASAVTSASATMIIPPGRNIGYSMIFGVGLIAAIESIAEIKEWKIKKFALRGHQFDEIKIDWLLKQFRDASLNVNLPLAIGGEIDPGLTPEQNFAILGPAILMSLIAVVWDRNFDEATTRKLIKDTLSHIKAKDSKAFLSLAASFRGTLVPAINKAGVGALLKDIIEWTIDRHVSGLHSLYTIPFFGDIFCTCLQAHYDTSTVAKLKGCWEVFWKGVESYTIGAMLTGQGIGTCFGYAVLSTPVVATPLALGALLGIWSMKRKMDQTRQEYEARWNEKCFPFIDTLKEKISNFICCCAKTKEQVDMGQIQLEALSARLLDESTYSQQFEPQPPLQMPTPQTMSYTPPSNTSSSQTPSTSSSDEDQLLDQTTESVIKAVQEYVIAIEQLTEEMEKVNLPTQTLPLQAPTPQTMDFPSSPKPKI